MESKKKWVYLLVCVVVVLCVAAEYYAIHPAINIHETLFWSIAFILFLLLGILTGVRKIRKMAGGKKNKKNLSARF